MLITFLVTGSNSDVTRMLGHKKKREGGYEADFYRNLPKSIPVVTVPVKGKQPRFKGGYYPAYGQNVFRNPNVYLNSSYSRRRLGKKKKHDDIENLDYIPAKHADKAPKLSDFYIESSYPMPQIPINRIHRRPGKNGTDWPYVKTPMAPYAYHTRRLDKTEISNNSVTEQRDLRAIRTVVPQYYKSKLMGIPNRNMITKKYEEYIQLPNKSPFYREPYQTVRERKVSKSKYHDDHNKYLR